MDGIGAIHEPVLDLNMGWLHLSKLLAHTSALYSPTTVQMRQEFLLVRVVGCRSVWSEDDWAQCTGQFGPVARGPILKGTLPLAMRRAQNAQA